MGYSEMIEILQKRHKEQIVLCRNGNFYIAIGKDAILLNKILGLKLTCMKPEICKVGFPQNALDKYTNLLLNKRYNYILYDFNSEKAELTIIQSFMGKYRNEEIMSNICYKCPNNCTNKKMDKYMLAIKKL